MRLPPERIKQGILHPQREVREAAVCYFSDAFLPDLAIMPLVMQAVDKYGFPNTFSAEHFPEALPQTEESIRWLLGQVSRIAQSREESKDDYRIMFSFLLAGAELDLLASLEPAILGCEALHERARRIIYERLRLRDASPEQCWQDLETFCEQHKEDEFVNESDLVYAYALVEGIARGGEGQAPRVLEKLEIEAGEDTLSAEGWMEGLAVRLAGEMRLPQAAAKVAGKLRFEGEWLSEECERALIRIGTDEVVRSLADEYRAWDNSVRDFTITTLERIYSDLCVQTCRELIEFETDLDLKYMLHFPLLSNFDSDGVEQARRFLRDHPLIDAAHLKRELLAVATLMKMDIPERRAWEEEESRRSQEFKGARAPEFPVVDSVDELLAQQRRNQEQQRRRQEQALATALPLPKSLFRREKVGRNAPCPCGSGKKFKNCCMRGRD